MQIFALVAGTNDATVKLFVVNAHLTAGPSADRRLRQVHEALETVEKDGGGCHDGVGTLGKLREKLQNKNSWSFADKLRSLQDKKKHDDEKDRFYGATSNE